MRKIPNYLFIAGLLLLSSCISKVLDASGIKEVQGIVYEKGSNSPFTGIVELKYPDGNLKAKGEFVEGKADGLHEEWYQNGQLKAKGEFVLGQEEGVFTEWNEDGTVKRKILYKNGRISKDLLKKVSE
jgi:antitoxin component YwqK of YwqJK toxin-antitoxin module